MTDKITIERETLQEAVYAMENATMYDDADFAALDALKGALRAALAAQPADAQQEPVAWQEEALGGWKEATIGWSVCASVHLEWAKGKDGVFKTRQADFVRHENDARSKYTALSAAQPADAQPTGQSPCARHCEAPSFEGEIRRLKRELQTQAERIRVLREALDVARNGLAWYIDMHPDEADDSDAETMAQIDAALEATK